MKIFFTTLFILFNLISFGQNDSISNKTIQKDTLTKVERIEIINKSFDSLVTKLIANDKDSMSDFLIPLLIGAGLTLVVQFSIEIWKTCNEKKKKKRELISKAKAKIYLITQILKDLAMHKVHKQYYLRASRLNLEEKTYEDSHKKHYDKGELQRATEAKLDDNIADYFKIVTEYAILSNRTKKFQIHFDRIFDYEHPVSDKFEDCVDSKTLVEGLKKEEKRLNDEYKNLTKPFNDIYELMG